MSLELQKLSELLEGFKQMCGQFTGQVSSHAERILQNYNATARVFDEQESKLKTYLNSQKEQGAVVNVEKQRFVAARDQLERRLAELETGLQVLRKEVQSLGDEKAALERDVLASKVGVSQAEKGRIPPELEERLNNYKTMLRMDISLDKGSLKVAFWGIDKANEARQFSFTVETTPDRIQITQLSDPLDDVDKYADECQLTGNYALLVRRIRRAFAQRYAVSQ